MTSDPDATLVIVAYRPRPGKADALLQLIREHVPILRAGGLASGRPFIAARASDGTVVEVFEWLPGAIARAHANSTVLALWETFADVCEIVPRASLSEASTMCASFTPLNL